MPDLDLQNATTASVPEPALFQAWVDAALAGRRIDWELAIRLVDEPEGRTLNHDYRGRDAATNVLSFPVDLPEGVDLPLLGDLVICAPVVVREAAEQGKSETAHWAHLTVHGVLHLLGFDHATSVEADVMEGEEQRVMAQLGFSDPYA
ncbi:rRNA maturation RNase YbeY [Spiribacter salinus]|uniref:rRNA maturation RNase YbeY n=1 Tax=Spiribacter salinus TaxID=1335746 RepID=UPI001C959D93|nr:rRNA maturation RNase YbeY [Spiribacter salinus]MBY5269140.1 rRNA maturation RNase YbeY [Spiribacter salinus]